MAETDQKRFAGRDAFAPRGARFMILHVLSALVGTWLMFSAFAWPHSHAQRAFTAICGLLTFSLALLTMYLPPLRYFNAVNAAVLVAMTVSASPRGGLTYWSNGFAAIAIIALAFFDGTRSSRQRPMPEGR
jgi:hypothetical protein